MVLLICDMSSYLDAIDISQLSGAPARNGCGGAPAHKARRLAVAARPGEQSRRRLDRRKGATCRLQRRTSNGGRGRPATPARSESARRAAAAAEGADSRSARLQQQQQRQTSNGVLAVGDAEAAGGGAAVDEDDEQRLSLRTPARRGNVSAAAALARRNDAGEERQRCRQRRDSDGSKAMPARTRASTAATARAALGMAWRNGAVARYQTD
ncbi:hypothetical protein Scep_003580 [Stephania cephalantha]|uniref:Uncharacterized protein n=1 Tax=Stephania cephalantha TaxID=152367 RepID=A0AAP0KQW5_9MAGN